MTAEVSPSRRNLLSKLIKTDTSLKFLEGLANFISMIIFFTNEIVFPKIGFSFVSPQETVN